MPFAPPQQNLPGPMDDWARKLPQSQPGTLFGVPLATLRDVSFQRKALTFLGAALLIAIFIPASFSPFLFAFKGNAFKGLVWPLIAGASYLLVAIAPKDIRDKVPPIVLEWLPFSVSYAGVLIVGLGLTFGGESAFSGLYAVGMTTLVFGLLARLQRPDDQVARIIIAAGAVCLLVPLADAFEFGGPAFVKIHNILFIAVLFLGLACVLYVVPPRKLPPALQAIDAFAPHVTAALLLWLPLQLLLMFLVFFVHVKLGFVVALLMLLRGLLTLLAFFGVLMLTAPAAYDALMAMFKKNGGPPPGYGGPPPGYGGPPPGYGGPPPGYGGPPPGYGGPPPGGPPPGGPPPGWNPPQ